MVNGSQTVEELAIQVLEDETGSSTRYLIAHEDCHGICSEAGLLEDIENHVTELCGGCNFDASLPASPGQYR